MKKGLKVISQKEKKITDFKQSLPVDHLIYIMMIEHEKICEVLDNLSIINQEIQKAENFSLINVEYIKFNNVINLLIKASVHHKRDEEVLFPQLSLVGLFGHTFVKALEHEQVLDYIDELLALSSKVKEVKFNDWKQRIDILVKFLIIKLKENIDDENISIYPKAIQLITEDETWEKMKRQSDRIGYCNFEDDFK